MATHRTIELKSVAAADLIDLALDSLEFSAYVDVLYNLRLAERRVQAAMADCVELARKRGDTWMEIGLALNVTAQGAQQRYGPRPSPAVVAASEVTEGQLAAVDD